MSKKSDSQSRKWLLTINNPVAKGFTHERIKAILAALKSVIYYCISDEIGPEEKTPHSHVFIAAKTCIRFSTMKRNFPEAHIDIAQGTSEEVKDYVEKNGKWANGPKADTKVPNTFEEWGELPDEQQGHRSDWDEVYKLLEEGHSVMDIIRTNTSMIRYRSTLEQMRQELIAEQYRETFRNIETTYIYGTTGLGKTRLVMEKYGYSNVCQITSYERGCFDKYRGEDVLLLDEFDGKFPIQEMNNYLDGYPLMLPCRYANRVACYTKVFIISNIPLEDQYSDAKSYHRAVWDALIRRIHQVLVFYAPKEFDTFTTEEYLRPYPSIKGVAGNG